MMKNTTPKQIRAIIAERLGACAPCTIKGIAFEITQQTGIPKKDAIRIATEEIEKGMDGLTAGIPKWIQYWDENKDCYEMR